ncbi:hypothetical protein [Nitratidesulfovibrio sp. SRB-5]|uniref:hypothetical protein n=1 Tax=Nitratidesulfovibrio sp. SRB-5 TaxID=2872636 RepID=UPI001027AF55|nr:hypothetical protein [Nitratidesulfovibrio sp. SRB-5]MBZ2173059.1 hypothetical protein [Nitratidesulfovibrio sp. SRB-5]RXF75267.1 hypothetical protein EKK70_15645 [Desulfovibrio sp. DS-1]
MHIHLTNEEQESIHTHRHHTKSAKKFLCALSNVFRYDATLANNQAMPHLDITTPKRIVDPGHRITDDKRHRKPGVGWEYVHAYAE